MIEYKIILGRNIPNSSEVVTDADLDKFEVEVIDKEYDGYGIIHGWGKWKGEKEKTVIYTFIIESKDEIPKIDIIADQYLERFRQESTLETAINLEVLFRENKLLK